MTGEELEAIRRGYPPEAHKVVCIDYDGTLFPFGFLDADPEPHAGAVAATQRLKAAGYRIVIFTARLSPSWLASTGRDATAERTRLVDALARHGVQFDDVTSEKVPAVAYVDDRAIRFVPGEWEAITDWIIWSEPIP